MEQHDENEPASRDVERDLKRWLLDIRTKVEAAAVLDKDETAFLFDSAEVGVRLLMKPAKEKEARLMLDPVSESKHLN